MVLAKMLRFIKLDLFVQLQTKTLPFITINVNYIYTFATVQEYYHSGQTGLLCTTWTKKIYKMNLEIFFELFAFEL